MKYLPIVPDLDLSIISSYLPSRTQLVDASESALEGVTWLGQIGLEQTKKLCVWSVQTIQALYEIDWNQITLDDLTFENFIQLVSFEVFAGKK